MSEPQPQPEPQQQPDPDANAEPLGDPQEIGQQLEEMGGLDTVEESSGPSGIFQGLGPLSNTEPNPDIETVDSPKFSQEYARKYAYRGFMKVQGSRPTALSDFLWSGLCYSVSMFSPPDDGSPDGNPGGNDAVRAENMVQKNDIGQ